VTENGTIRLVGGYDAARGVRVGQTWFIVDAVDGEEAGEMRFLVYESAELEIGDLPLELGGWAWTLGERWLELEREQQHGEQLEKHDPVTGEKIRERDLAQAVVATYICYILKLNYIGYPKSFIKSLYLIA
jgi:hypothetical protein